MKWLKVNQVVLENAPFYRPENGGNGSAYTPNLGRRGPFLLISVPIGKGRGNVPEVIVAEDRYGRPEPKWRAPLWHRFGDHNHEV